MNAYTGRNVEIIREYGPDHPELLKNDGRSSSAGGQHRASIGTSTYDGETDVKFVGGLRRAYTELGKQLPVNVRAMLDSLGGPYRASVGTSTRNKPDHAWLGDFEYQQRALADEPEIAY